MHGRHEEDRRRLKKLAEECGSALFGGAYYSESKKRYIRCWKSEWSYCKFCKKKASKASRRRLWGSGKSGYKRSYGLADEIY